ncbi:MAG: Membrane-associated zinc metalloprotease, partial [uncultured Thermoleophilia bacterium]
EPARPDPRAPVPDPDPRGRPLPGREGRRCAGDQVLRRLPACRGPQAVPRHRVRARSDPARRLRPHRRDDAPPGRRPLPGGGRRGGGRAAGRRRPARRADARRPRAERRHARRAVLGRARAGRAGARGARGRAAAPARADPRPGPQGPAADRRGGRPARLLAPRRVATRRHHLRRPGRQHRRRLPDPGGLLHGRHPATRADPPGRRGGRELARRRGGPAARRRDRRRGRPTAERAGRDPRRRPGRGRPTDHADGPPRRRRAHARTAGRTAGRGALAARAAVRHRTRRHAALRPGRVHAAGVREPDRRDRGDARPAQGDRVRGGSGGPDHGGRHRGSVATDRLGRLLPLRPGDDLAGPRHLQPAPVHAARRRPHPVRVDRAGARWQAGVPRGRLAGLGGRHRADADAVLRGTVERRHAPAGPV